MGWSVVGHDPVVRALAKGLEQGRTSHAYLFVGPTGVGKMHLALNLSQALNCTQPLPEQRPCGACAQCRRIMARKHADIQVVGLPTTSGDGPARKTIPIDAIKEMQAAAGLQPFEGKYKVCIIDGADSLSPDAANRLLKTLEEPPAAVVLLLLAENEEDILETILSRCQTLRLRPVPRQVIEQHLVTRCEVEPAQAAVLAALADGCIGWAIQAAQDRGLLDDREAVFEEVARLPLQPYHERMEIARGMADGFSRKREEVYLWLALLQQLWRDLLLAKGGQMESLIHAHRAEGLRETHLRRDRVWDQAGSGDRRTPGTQRQLAPRPRRADAWVAGRRPLTGRWGKGGEAQSRGEEKNAFVGGS